MPGPRVLHISPAAFGGDNQFFGGCERYVLELAKAMARKVPTTVLTFGKSPGSEQIGPLTVKTMRNWINFRRFRANPLNLRAFAAMARFDLVHVHQTYTLNASCGALLGRILGIPVFTTNHGDYGLGLHQIFNTTSWFAGHLHVSQFSRRLDRHEGRATARVIYGGVDPARFKPGHRTAHSDEVLVVSRLLPHKGINYVIDALDERMRLRVIGRTFRHAGRYRQLLAEGARGKRVIFDEQCGDQELLRAYQQCLCIVAASVYRSVFDSYHPNTELLGLSVLEGMACGRPAIVTEVASFPELVVDGVTGFIVPPNNPVAIRAKIAWFLEHPQETDAMGRAARERVLRHFTWEAAAARCLEAYREVATPKRADGAGEAARQAARV